MESGCGCGTRGGKPQITKRSTSGGGGLVMIKPLHGTGDGLLTATARGKCKAKVPGNNEANNSPGRLPEDFEAKKKKPPSAAFTVVYIFLFLWAATRPFFSFFLFANCLHRNSVLLRPTIRPCSRPQDHVPVSQGPGEVTKGQQPSRNAVVSILRLSSYAIATQRALSHLLGHFLSWLEVTHTTYFLCLGTSRHSLILLNPYHPAVRSTVAVSVS
jgi:hypothetical protein